MNRESKLRYGFTTGSCAASAAKAAAFMLFTGQEKKQISIQTPKGILYNANIHDILRMENAVSCAVEKDGGDDSDVTSGFFIYAKVEYKTWDEKQEAAQIVIEGGEGVGRVTKPGLDQPVGNAAINKIPREMIEREVKQVCEMADFHGKLFVTISVPNGEELSKKTFNPRLGIVGGISILGTTGIVEPMSERALLDTILVELRQRRALGEEIIAVTPGNYGQAYMKQAFGYDLDKSIKCSNYIGDTIDMAAECGFKKMLLTGHIGKLIKVSGGMMNTHSKEGDCRMELLAAAALQKGISSEIVCRILGCVGTEEALEILRNAKVSEVLRNHEVSEGVREGTEGVREGTEGALFYCVMDSLMEKIMFYLTKRAGEKMQMECILYSNQYGGLAFSKGAKELMKELSETEES